MADDDIQQQLSAFTFGASEGSSPCPSSTSSEDQPVRPAPTEYLKCSTWANDALGCIEAMMQSSLYTNVIAKEYLKSLPVSQVDQFTKNLVQERKEGKQRLEQLRMMASNMLECKRRYSTFGSTYNGEDQPGSPRFTSKGAFQRRAAIVAPLVSPLWMEEDNSTRVGSCRGFMDGMQVVWQEEFDTLEQRVRWLDSMVLPGLSTNECSEDTLTGGSLNHDMPDSMLLDLSYSAEATCVANRTPCGTLANNAVDCFYQLGKATQEEGGGGKSPITLTFQIVVVHEVLQLCKQTLQEVTRERDVNPAESRFVARYVRAGVLEDEAFALRNPQICRTYLHVYSEALQQAIPQLTALLQESEAAGLTDVIHRKFLQECPVRIVLQNCLAAAHAESRWVERCIRRPDLEWRPPSSNTSSVGGESFYFASPSSVDSLQSLTLDRKKSIALGFSASSPTPPTTPGTPIALAGIRFAHQDFSPVVHGTGSPSCPPDGVPHSCSLPLPPQPKQRKSPIFPSMSVDSVHSILITSPPEKSTQNTFPPATPTGLRYSLEEPTTKAQRRKGGIFDPIRIDESPPVSPSSLSRVGSSGGRGFTSSPIDTSSSFTKLKNMLKRRAS